MKVFITFTFVLCFIFQMKPSFGNEDMHLKEILSANPDTNKVKLLCDLCWNYRFKSADSALYFGNQAMLLARDLGFKKGIAQACNDMAIILIDKANYQRSSKLLEE